MGTIAIGDVHGQLAALDRLLEAAAPTDDDELIFLGDLIDRGPDSRGVVQRVLELSSRRRVTCMRGNHEAMLLGARADRRCLSWLGYGGLATIDSYVDGVSDACRPLLDEPLAHRTEFPIEPFLSAVPAEHWELLEATQLWVRRGEFFVCHGGVDPGKADPAESSALVLTQGHSRFPGRYTGAETVLFGHRFTGKLRGDSQPLPFVSEGRNAVGIDTGVHLPEGWLTALRLEERRGTQVSVESLEVRKVSLE